MAYTPPSNTNVQFNFTDFGYSAPSSTNVVFDFGVSDEEEAVAILAGTSRNFTSVWADTSASRNNAYMYVASAGSGAALSVVNLSLKSLSDSYSTSTQGDFGENLEREDIVDIVTNTTGT